MRYVAFEYTTEQLPDNPVKGYLRIPDTFPALWSSGFINYLKDTYNVNPRLINIYPLQVNNDSKILGDSPKGYKNLEDEFIKALRSIKYYPPCERYNAIRRSWSLNDPDNMLYAPKERK